MKVFDSVGHEFYVSWINDNDGVEDCYYCEVFADEGEEWKVDDFVVRADDIGGNLADTTALEKYIAYYYLDMVFAPTKSFDGQPLPKQFITAEDIAELYNDWKERHGVAPNRVIVKMAWEDGDNTEKGWQRDVIALDSYEGEEYPADDEEVLFYAGDGYEGLIDLLREGNGSDFILIDIIDFYKV